MKIAVVGTGSVGRALGGRLAALGHQVVFGSRSPASGRVEQLVESAGEGLSAALPREAVADAAVVFLATPWEATEPSIRSLEQLGDRVLVDCTNPLLPDMSGLDILHGRSGGEQVAEWADGGRVVKAFNTTGAGNLADSHYIDGHLVMPLCGDDPGARDIVAGLALELGFEPVDCGGLRSAVLLEHLAMLWITLARDQGLGANIGLSLLRREG